jgi:hypothetical protein
MLLRHTELVLTAIQSFGWTQSEASRGIRSVTEPEILDPFPNGKTRLNGSQPPIPRVLGLIERHKDFLTLDAHQVRALKAIKRSYWLQYRRQFQRSLLHGAALHNAITTGNHEQDIPDLSRALEQDRRMIGQIVARVTTKLDALLSSEQIQRVHAFSSDSPYRQFGFQ